MEAFGIAELFEGVEAGQPGGEHQKPGGGEDGWEETWGGSRVVRFAPRFAESKDLFGVVEQSC